MTPTTSPATTIVARNDKTGSHTSCLSDFKTAHDALAISIDLCHRVMTPLSTIAGRVDVAWCRPARSVPGVRCGCGRRPYGTPGTRPRQRWRCAAGRPGARAGEPAGGSHRLL